MATETRFRGMTVFTLALACALLAVIWPQWRSELQGYGYHYTPSITIGPPGPKSTSAGPVHYQIKYAGANSVTLAASDVTLNRTGTATGTVTVSGTGKATRQVTISSIQGNGTLGISIAANTASDKSGRHAPAAGPSKTFRVNNPAITAVSPNGGETLAMGATFPITWQFVGDPGPALQIVLLKGTKATILNNKATTSAGSWSWTVSTKIAAGTDYKIRITSKTIHSCTLTSAASFTISEATGLQTSAGPDQSVQGSSLVTLSGSNTVEAPKGGVSYQWTQLDGPQVTLSSPFERETTFVAPAAAAGGESLKFQLTASGKDGGLSQDTSIVNVTDNNDAPVADAGQDQTVISSEIVQLDGSKSSDREDGIVSYEWKQVGGATVELLNADSAQPAFIAPEVSASECLAFELTVTNRGGLRSRATSLVTVKAEYDPPIASAGANQTVVPRAVVTLDGSSSTAADGPIASYHWTQIAGMPVVLADPTTVKTSFTAPQATRQSEKLVFQLTVTDDAGLQGKGKIAVVVLK